MSIADARNEVNECMTSARLAEVVDAARGWETDAQNAAQAGHLASVPKLTKHELAVIAQKDAGNRR
jgi:hypothetical protein